MKIYVISPTLDGEMRGVEAELEQLYTSASPDITKVVRLERRRHRIKSRYGFDYTVTANWYIAGFGCAAMAGLLAILRALS